MGVGMGWGLEDGGWRVEDGGWMMEGGGWGVRNWRLMCHKGTVPVHYLQISDAQDPDVP
jgi:hypothetical protein